MSDVPLADRDLDALVPEWLDWAQVAEVLGVSPGKVRTMIRDHELAAAVSRPGAGPRVPADLLQDGAIVKGIPGLLTVLHGQFSWDVELASAVAVMASMVVTFALNEMWTWHDRGSGNVMHRAMSYVPINFGGLIINTGLLYVLVHQFNMHYLLANLIGAAAAAVWNFSLNNTITWRA